MTLVPLGNTPDQLTQVWMRRPPTKQHIDAAPHAAETDRHSLFIARTGPALVLAFLVGTGGLSTANYVAERNQRGYRFNDFEYGVADSHEQKPLIEVRSPAENLARVKRVFEPSVTELASVFNVSRQTIYNWQAGQAIAQENEHRLSQLALAAEMLEEQGLAGKISVLRRAITDGKNLLQLVREGTDPPILANALIETIRHELDQRRRLDARLANRARKPVKMDDVGVPHFDERA